MTRSLRTRLAALAAIGGLASGHAAAQQPVQFPPPEVEAPLSAPVAPGVEKAVPGPAPLLAATQPQVVRWPGGYMIMNGPEVVVRHNRTSTGRSTNLVTGSGNGFGNTIVVDNGPGGGGVTVVKNARNGIGNRLIVGPDDLLLDLDLPAWTLPAIRCKPAPVEPVVAPKLPAADPVPDQVPAAPAPVQPAAAVPTYKGKANPFWEKKAWSDAHDCNLYWSPADKAWFRYHSEDDTYRPVPGGPETPVIVK